MRLALCLCLLALPAAAQDAGAVLAVIQPKLQELAPGRPGEVMAQCVTEIATPDEMAEIARIATPNDAVGAIVSAVLARPEALDCITRAMQ